MSAEFTDAEKERWTEAMPTNLEVLSARFKTSKNSMYIWEAVALCNLEGLPAYPLPAWCVHYLAQVAAGLIHLSQSHSRGDSERTNKRIVNVLRLNHQNRNDVQRYANEKASITAAMMIEAFAHTNEEEKIVEWVMKKRGVERRGAIEHIKLGKSLLSARRKLPVLAPQ